VAIISKLFFLEFLIASVLLQEKTACRENMRCLIKLEAFFPDAYEDVAAL
jgi:hypothetical protein